MKPVRYNYITVNGHRISVQQRLVLMGLNRGPATATEVARNAAGGEMRVSCTRAVLHRLLKRGFVARDEHGQWLGTDLGRSLA